MTPEKTRQIVNKYSFRVKKGYGQHFLIDEHVKAKIINACELTKDDFVIEIGPGIGSLTEALAGRAGKVCAIEIDGGLIPILAETLADYENVEIINNDALKTDINEIIKKSGMKSVKVAANLPYNIATAVITELLGKRYPIETITVMVQKEVAERLMAGPGTKNYSSLSLFIQYYSEPFLVANVPVNSFVPRPNVDSAVVRLNVRKKPPECAMAANGELLFKIIRAAFAHRRKTLVNCLADENIEKDELERILCGIGLSKQIRGEAMSLEDFARLAVEIGKREEINYN